MRRLGRILPVLTALGVIVSLGAGRPDDLPDPGRRPPNGHFTLWQLPLVVHGNSYVIQSPTGKVVVFDGGSDGSGTGINGGRGPVVDAKYLRQFLGRLGGHVDAWFISHAHSDHVSVLTSILESPDLQGLTIDRVYGQIPSEPWLQTYESVNMLPTARAFKSAMSAQGKTLNVPSAGDNICIDGMDFKILTEIDETNGIIDPNDYSMVIRLATKGTSILFLGDLGVEGGKLLLAGPYGNELKSEYVQMAHHGNWGVGRRVYEAVAPKYVLWPAQAWLYDAPPGNPAGHDSWQVRRWMAELGVRKNYVMKDGLVQLDLPMTAIDPNDN